MTINKKIFVLGFLFLFLFLTVSEVQATVVEPSLTVYGTVTKDVTDLSNIWLYENDNGENETLPYTRNGNLTIQVGKIKFPEPFLNKTVTAFAEAGMSQYDSELQLLQDADEIPYILFTMTNSSALTAGTMYDRYFTFSVDTTLTDNSHLLIAIKTLTNTSDISRIRVDTGLWLVDEGGEDHVVFFMFDTSITDYSYSVVDYAISDSDTATDDVQFAVPLRFGELQCFQIKIDEINNILSVSNVKITKGIIRMFVKTDASQSTSQAKTQIKIFNRFEKEVKINDITLNRTNTITIDSDTLNPTVEIEKIADVQMPFKYTLEPERSFNDNELSVRYNWEFILPDDSTLSFSNVKLNTTAPSGTPESFYINGQDYLSSIENEDSGAEVTVLNSISAGTQYIVTMKVIYSETEYDEIVETENPPPFWRNPAEAIFWWFWSFIGFIASILSLKGLQSTAKRKKRYYKTKVKNKGG